jgi:methylmalonyl-CoA/ethylmalonyl-CoA epimerase
MQHPLLKRIDHIGIVVRNLDDAIAIWRDQLGFALLERVAIPEQLVEAAFLDGGNGTIELIAPTDLHSGDEEGGGKSGTARFLAARGEGTHHVCFEVEDIAETLRTLQSEGVRLIDETPRRGVHGRIAFIHPKASSGVMIELLQKESHG